MSETTNNASSPRYSREEIRAFQRGMDSALARAQHVPEGYVAGFPESVGGTIKGDEGAAK